MLKKIIYIAGDHAALELKARIVKYLESAGYKIKDFGPSKLNLQDDYPDFVIPAARAVARATPSLSPPPTRGRIKVGVLGIVLCGTGIGACIAANKVKGVRAALVYNIYTARMSRQHNNANILCLGALTTGKNFTTVKKILRVWLNTPFSKAPRHLRRLKKI